MLNNQLILIFILGCTSYFSFFFSLHIFFRFLCCRPHWQQWFCAEGLSCQNIRFIYHVMLVSLYKYNHSYGIFYVQHLSQLPTAKRRLSRKETMSLKLSRAKSREPELNIGRGGNCYLLLFFIFLLFFKEIAVLVWCFLNEIFWKWNQCRLVVITFRNSISVFAHTSHIRLLMLQIFFAHPLQQVKKT